MPKRTRPAHHLPLLQLGEELSAVINQVRRAFGPLPMARIAERPEVRYAEERVSRVARQVARGEEGRETWRAALCQYQNVWMELLAEAQTAESRHAA